MSVSTSTPASLLALSLVAAATLAACGGDDDHHHDGPDASPADAPPATGAVTLAFAHQVGGAPVAMGSAMPYTNVAGNQFGVTLVRYFISDVALTYGDGTVRTLAGAHYVDHDEAATRSYLLAADLPVGPLASVSFVMGLPPALNVTGAFPGPPESLMEWPVMMGGGYHHLKFEGRYVDSTGAPFNYKVHSGGLGGADNSFAVTLDASGHAVAADGTTLTLEMNLERWFGDWDLNDWFNAAHPGIMNDAAAQAAVRQHGATVFTLGQP